MTLKRSRTERNGKPADLHSNGLKLSSSIRVIPPLGPPSAPPPSPDPNRHLVSLWRKQELVRTSTRGVALGFQTGLFLYGKGGIGKTHTVTEELTALEVSYKVWNSRVSGWGLINNLEEYPSH